MSLFRRHRTEAPESTGHAGDDKLLALMAKKSDLGQPRHWVHYLYFDDEPAARAAASEVTAEGWAVQTVEQAASGDQWIAVAERPDAVTSPQAVSEARAFFEGVVSRHPGGEYDGWEASL